MEVATVFGATVGPPVALILADADGGTGRHRLVIADDGGEPFVGWLARAYPVDRAQDIGLGLFAIRLKRCLAGSPTPSPDLPPPAAGPGAP